LSNSKIPFFLGGILKKATIGVLIVFFSTAVLFAIIIIWQIDPMLEYRMPMGKERFDHTLPPQEKEKLIKTYLARVYSPLPFLPLAHRNWCITQIGKLKDSRAIEPLRDLLDDERYKCSAALALGDIGDPSTIPILKQMSERDDRWSWCAQRALTFFRLPELAPLYLEAIHADHGLLRRDAARALGAIKSQESFEALFDALRDEELCVRNAAGSALAEHGFPYTAEFIIAEIKKESNAQQLSTYFRTLIGLRDETSANSIIENLDLLIAFRWHLDRQVREHAFTLTDPFKTEENTSKFVRPREAGTELEEAEKDRERKLLQILRDDSIDPFKRRNAAEELSVAGNREVIPILIEYTKRRNIHDRRTGYFSLGRYDDPELLDIFKRGEKDPDPYIRTTSTQARRMHYGLTSKEKQDRTKKLIDALGHPEKYPKEIFLFVNVDEALELTKASTWRLFLNYLESQRKNGDTAAIRRIFDFLRKRNAIKMAQGLSALPTTQIREFIPFFAELPDLLADSTFQTLARELGDPVFNLLFAAYLSEERDTIVELTTSKTLSIEHLIHLIGASSEEIRLFAKQALEEMDAKKVRRKAIEILLSPGSEDRYLASKLLVRMRSGVVDDLLLAFHKTDYYGQQLIIMVFKEIGDEEAGRALREVEKE
jgi:HEAT repeat protein